MLETKRSFLLFFVTYFLMVHHWSFLISWDDVVRFYSTFSLYLLHFVLWVYYRLFSFWNKLTFNLFYILIHIFMYCCWLMDVCFFFSPSVIGGVEPRRLLTASWWWLAARESRGRQWYMSLPVLQPGGANTAARPHQHFFFYCQGVFLSQVLKTCSG